ncbi:RdgB/HAM1 family non-canonical purine NTP pyrophosphatase [Candidatus Uhrbacteria bacterium]|nr:RdgB/HAM1 family non-canonical purine NTP pyrophosphatase [Candidatus Uhrbacteria bacterium]
MKLIAATHNNDKLTEIRAILGGLNIEVISADDVGVYDDVQEDGKTLEENALKKARHVWKKVGGWVLADDTGVFIDALDGRPGIYAARWAGENVTGADLLTHTLRELEGIPRAKRTAEFVSVIALLSPDGGEHLFRGSVRGIMLESSRGQHPERLVYDSLFVPDGQKDTFAQMSGEKKNILSHRARALGLVKDFFNTSAFSGHY